MESENSSMTVQDSMADSFIPDLTNSSFESKNTNKQSWDDPMNPQLNSKWVMEDYPEDKVYGTPQKK
jgi:hypothetical protein